MKSYKNDPFIDLLDGFFGESTVINNPSSKVIIDDDKYTIHLAVPGLTKENLLTTIKNGYIVVSYKKDTTTKKHLFVNSFEKTFLIPDDVDENHIKGKVENGVLEIELPITKKKSLERLITLN